VHEPRAPKGGPKNAVRRVPIPPELVALLSEHIAAYGAGPDGRLFRTFRGGIYQPSTLWRVLQGARLLAFDPAQAASPLARKPYDFRHAGVSWRLAREGAGQTFSHRRTRSMGSQGCSLTPMTARPERTCLHGHADCRHWPNPESGVAAGISRETGSAFLAT
jgi:hypothetical protein